MCVERCCLTTPRSAFLASNEVNRIAIDKTGLTGLYYFQVDWVHDSPAASAENVPDGPSIFTAIEEKLGLKLVLAKAAVPMRVVGQLSGPLITRYPPRGMSIWLTGVCISF